MKGWRERAADIFTKHGEIAAKMKSAPGPLGFSQSRHGRPKTATQPQPNDAKWAQASVQSHLLLLFYSRDRCAIKQDYCLQPKVATEGLEVVLYVAGRVAKRVEDALPFIPVRSDGRDECVQPFRYFIRHGGDFAGWNRRRKRQHVPAVLF